jgi:hypothetical protein
MVDDRSGPVGRNFLRQFIFDPRRVLVKTVAYFYNFIDPVFSTIYSSGRKRGCWHGTLF